MTVGKAISMRELITIRECVKTLPFINLSLGNEQNDRAAFWTRIGAFLADCLMKHMERLELNQQIEDFFGKHYKESFFDFQVQYEMGIAKDKKKIFRMVDYICQQGYTAVAGKTVFQVKLQKDYRGIALECIQDYADMIFQTPEGRYLAVRLETGAPKYSYAARQESSMVKNAIELASLYLGLCETYGHGLEVAVFYLKNKDDKGSTLVDEYEHRNGKNIIRWSFSSMNEAWERLYASVKLNVPCDCPACWYREVCRSARFYSCTQPAAPEKKEAKKPQQSEQLTPQQEQVVRHKMGQMCVIAVPGAGKTHSLVRRMVHLIRVEHISPGKILFLTYTQKAAGEIRERVKACLDEGSGQPGVFTFNALGYSILREHPESVSGGFRLASKVDRYNLIEEVLKKVPRIQGVSYDGITGEFGLLATLNQAFDFIEQQGREPYREAYRKKKDVEGILKAYDVFSEEYKRKGYISFDDQICYVNELFLSKPEVLRYYQRQYQYIMCDEFQDVSESQVQMAYSLGAHGNIVVVGDDDQSIFGYRGGSSRYMLEFAHSWPEAKRVTMEDNFRSVDTVLHAADLVISKNSGRFAKKIRAHAFSMEKPVFINNMPAEGIWYLLQPLLRAGMMPGDIAIIARKNKELAAIEACLSPHVEVLPSRQFLIDDAVFSVIYDVLNLYYRGMEDGSFYRILRFMKAEKEIPAKNDKAESMHDWLCKGGLLLPIDWRDVDCLPTYKNRKEESRLFLAGYRLISVFKEIQYAQGLEELLGVLFRQLFGEENHLAVQALAELASQRMMETPYQLLEYMDFMLRYHDETEIEYPRRQEAVNLLTAHKSKGKEYPIVIVFNVESYVDTSEDRRLLYVAMTRAKQTLYLTQGPYTRAELVRDFIQHVNSQAG